MIHQDTTEAVIKAEKLTKLSVDWNNRGNFLDWRQMVGSYFELRAQNLCVREKLDYWVIRKSVIQESLVLK